MTAQTDHTPDMDKRPQDDRKDITVPGDARDRNRSAPQQRGHDDGERKQD